MTAFLQLNDRLEARMLAANAVRLAFFERFGRFPSPDDRLWQLDPFVRLECRAMPSRPNRCCAVAR